ncbi:E3 ubiquitin protein ligase rin2 [Plakobranchus ocellatus]|uniref:E3 ubiquitin protein ligase rin2 n=1 Tax=Plakobranchus ocellatus TaxID=259542 RepID=A0AAV3YEK7_9GAST|nr:E3 ubiquitin protein ligase rin2 [Plakobranchus ocellatus]
MTSEHATQSAALSAELESVKIEIPKIQDVKLVAAVPQLVRTEIYKTEHKQVAVTCLFQPGYPEVHLVTEIKSKTLGYKFLEGLAKICDNEAKKHIGKPQVVHIVQFVSNFIDENPLCVCADEISNIKGKLSLANDEVKLKQKTSQVVIKICQEEYFISLKLTIPDDYPLTQVVPDISEHNFPEFLRINFQAQATELARQCVQPPLKKKPKDPPFVPKPSLQPVVEYLIDCVKKYPLETCRLCHERALPVDPTNESATRGKHRVEKVYCGHLFHLICLHKHMKTPPFSEGKFCPACGKQIFHEKFKVSAKVLEDRWAHKQAKQRELEEVVDFLD